MGSPGIVTNELVVVRGQSKKWLLTVTDEDGVAYSLESGEVRMSVKKDEKADKAGIYKVSTDTDEIEIVTPQTDEGNTGKAYIYLKPADTIALEPGDYWYDVWVKNAAGDWSPVVKKARFTIEWSITVF